MSSPRFFPQVWGVLPARLMQELEGAAKTMTSNHKLRMMTLRGGTPAGDAAQERLFPVRPARALDVFAEVLNSGVDCIDISSNIIEMACVFWPLLYTIRWNYPWSTFSHVKAAGHMLCVTSPIDVRSFIFEVAWNFCPALQVFSCGLFLKCLRMMILSHHIERIDNVYVMWWMRRYKLLHKSHQVI